MQSLLSLNTKLQKVASGKFINKIMSFYRMIAVCKFDLFVVVVNP